MNIAESLGVVFPLMQNGQIKYFLGINMPDNKLTDYRTGERVPADLKMAAGLLLQYTTATMVDGKTVRKTIEQPASAAPLALKSRRSNVFPPADQGESEFDTFDKKRPVGLPPPGTIEAQPVTCQDCGAPLPMHVRGCLKTEVTVSQKPMSTHLVPAYVDVSDAPEWANRLERKTDAILELLVNQLDTLQKHQPQAAPAAGGGQGGAGGELHIVKIHIKPKGDKVAIDFYDDDPDHQYPEVRETRKSHRWANTLPKVIGVDDEQVIKVDWDLVYKLSSNLTEKGNPYKDVVRITPRK